MDTEKKYIPELGQAAFGQPYKEYEVPVIWEAALSHLDAELRRVMWNIHQKEYASPFSNTGASFEGCKEFSVFAYSWDFDSTQEFNFKWRNVEISWYKYLGRSMSANMPLTADLSSEMLEECVTAVLRYELEQRPDFADMRV